MALAWYFGSNFCPVCKQKGLSIKPALIECDVCKAFTRSHSYFAYLVVWTRDKSFWWRLPFLIYFSYIFYRLLQDPMFAMQRGRDLLNLVNFGIHELGHIIFMPFGVLMTILGGSLAQCIFPVVWLLAAYGSRWYFGAALCVSWIGMNLLDVSVYIGDARARQLPLASLANDYDSAHDWFQILTRLGRLEKDLFYAGIVRNLGYFLMISGILLAAGFLVMILIQSDIVKKEEAEARARIAKRNAVALGQNKAPIDQMAQPGSSLPVMPGDERGPGGVRTP